ncbi:hypothetical protein TPA0910_46730 [Streptomyces hygroscopicus subsp. sporocinereus]|uniref:Transposase n=1 Tax=Streptomyces hygroscopicus TaxID=1912 RepID=A0ABQ3U3P6_STRHY|nr:hypothetical protein TPA0910_46730 [Streptomyces hygroscopicus]
MRSATGWQGTRLTAHFYEAPGKWDQTIYHHTHLPPSRANALRSRWISSLGVRSGVAGDAAHRGAGRGRRQAVAGAHPGGGRGPGRAWRAREVRLVAGLRRLATADWPEIGHRSPQETGHRPAVGPPQTHRGAGPNPPPLEIRRDRTSPATSQISLGWA